MNLPRVRLGDLCERFALRVAPDGDRYGWWPVMGRRFYVPDWYNFPLFVYRDDYIVFAVHEPTGLTIAVGPHQNAAIEATVVTLCDKTRADFFNLLMDARRKLHVGPNPAPTYDTRTANETPRSKAPVRRGRPKKSATVQGV